MENESFKEHPAYKYAVDVCQGNIITGKYIKKVCKRFLEDIEDEKCKYIIDYNKGLKISEIANKYNVDSHTVINHLKNAKIYKSPKYLDYNFNTTYFKNIDDEHKAYWLGFIYADGSISGKSAM